MTPASNVSRKLPVTHRPPSGTRVLPLCVGNVLDRAMLCLGHALPSIGAAKGCASLPSEFGTSLAWRKEWSTTIFAF